MERLTVLAFRLGWACTPRIPEAFAIRLFDVLADLAWLRHGPGVRRLQSNLSRVTGLAQDDIDLRDVSRRALRSYARYWREMFSLGAWSELEVSQRLRVVGKERLDAALAQGDGVVLAATHSGNWDLPAAWGGRVYGRATTVAERLRPVSLFDEFAKRREHFGIEVLPHEGGVRPPFGILLERLRAGGLVALVSDRDLSDRGVEVDFFGRRARMAAGPAALARATGAALLPVAVWNEGPQVVFSIHERIPVTRQDPVETITQRLADVFADDIAAHPEDWHMLQRVWVEEHR